MELHVVLERHPEELPQPGDVVVTVVDAVELDAAGGRVVETREQLDQGGLAGPVLAHDRHPLAGTQANVEVPQDGAFGAGIFEGHAGQIDATGHGGRRHRLPLDRPQRAGIVAGVQVDEIEVALRVQAALDQHARTSGGILELSPRLVGGIEHQHQRAERQRAADRIDGGPDPDRHRTRHRQQSQKAQAAHLDTQDAPLPPIQVDPCPAVTLEQRSPQSEQADLLRRHSSHEQRREVVAQPLDRRLSVPHHVQTTVDPPSEQKLGHHGSAQDEHGPRRERGQQPQHRNQRDP